MENQTIPRVLVIDDNEAIHTDFRKAFDHSDEEEFDEFESDFFGEEQAKSSNSKYVIDSAYQGKEGFEMVQQALSEGSGYALAFVDVRMPPGWDGIKTIKKIWEICPDLQVVICSAYSDYSWDEMLAVLDASDKLLILKKPFEKIEVQQMALALTAKWKLEIEAKNQLKHLEVSVAERTRSLELINSKLQCEIDDRRKAEEEKAFIEIQLNQAQKLEAIGQLSAGIAHEINTPMQYIGDNTRFVKQAIALVEDAMEVCIKRIEADSSSGGEPASMTDSEKKRLLKKIPKAISQSRDAIEDTLEGVDRVIEILKAMKVFSRVGQEEKDSIDLQEAINSTVTIAKSEWNYVAEVVVDIPSDLPRIPGYASDINQVLLNLIVNAAHAIGEKSNVENSISNTISISAKVVSEKMELRVGDTGSGIPVHVRSKIFEPFFTTKEVGKGTGQGLSFVYANITQKHGGNIEFETELGEGTVFIITLPLHDSGI